MNVQLTVWHEKETCTWCEKSLECVTADFGDGFIKHAPLCWKCLQKAVKVRNRQEAAATSEKATGSPQESKKTEAQSP